MESSLNFQVLLWDTSKIIQKIEGEVQLRLQSIKKEKVFLILPYTKKILIFFL